MNTSWWCRALVLVSAMVCGMQQAEIPFTQLKGLYTVLDQNKKHLSLVHGFNWWELGVIENMYRYGDQKDATIKLIKELFNLQHNDVVFQISTLPTNPAKYFTVRTIGKILNYLEQESGLKQGYNQAALSAIINDKDFQQAAAGELERLENAFAQAQKDFKQSSQIVKTLPENEKKEQEEGRQKNRKIREHLRTQVNQLKKQNWDEAIGKIASLIIESLNECANKKYLPDTLYTILLAFCYKRAGSKQDCLDYFNEFGPLKIVTINDEQEWLAQEYTEQDYDRYKKALEQDPKQALADYELASFYGYAYRLWEANIYPPFIRSIDSVVYKNNKMPFSDCGETSLRNFFNIVLYDKSKKGFDVSLLVGNNDTKEMSLSPALIEFYKNPLFNSVNNLIKKESYDAWANVVSAIPGGRYSRQQCEITPGLTNMLTILGALIFGPGNQAYLKKNNKERLDAIVKAVSRDNFIMSWAREGSSQLDGKKDEDTTIIFTTIINKKTYSFAWEFTKKNFVIKQTQKSLAQTNLPVLKSAIAGISFQDSALRTIVGWYVGDYFGLLLLQLRSKLVVDNTFTPEVLNLFYFLVMQQPLTSHADRERVITNLLVSDIPLYVPVMGALIRLFPSVYTHVVRDMRGEGVLQEYNPIGNLLQTIIIQSKSKEKPQQSEYATALLKQLLEYPAHKKEYELMVQENS